MIYTFGPDLPQRGGWKWRGCICRRGHIHLEPWWWRGGAAGCPREVCGGVVNSLGYPLNIRACAHKHAAASWVRSYIVHVDVAWLKRRNCAASLYVVKLSFTWTANTYRDLLPALAVPLLLLAVAEYHLQVSGFAARCCLCIQAPPPFHSLGRFIGYEVWLPPGGTNQRSGGVQRRRGQESRNET